MKEYNSNMKISEIKTDMRKTVMGDIAEFLASKYGKENFGLVSANTFGVIMGSYEDEDGYVNDTCCEILVRAKSFYDKAASVNEDGKQGREIKLYDLQTKIDNYKNGVEE